MSLPPMKCPECPYDKHRNLGTHLFFVHGYSKNKIAEWRMNMKADMISRSRDLFDIFRCRFCPKTYKRQNSCRAHERVVHSIPSNQRQKCVPCPVRNCAFETTALLDLCAHAKESHSEMGDFSIREARFDNMTFFQKWRLAYEESTSSVLATESVNSNAAAGTTLRYLRCAQLEAQIRKARTHMRGGEETMNAGMADDYDDDNVEEQEEAEMRREESSRPATPPVEQGKPRRSPRKRRHEEYAEMKEEEEKRKERARGGGGVGAAAAADAADAAQEEEEEEVDVDVEQVDEMDDATTPSSSSPSVPATTASPSKTTVSTTGTVPIGVRLKARTTTAASIPYRSKIDEAPRLQRESSAHLDEPEESAASAADREESEEAAAMMAEERDMEKRMNSRHCTAHMRVLILRTGAVHVEYCIAHLGHEVVPVPAVSRSEDRMLDRQAKQQPTTMQQLQPVHRTAMVDEEEQIKMAKERRKGRRETENRWMKDRRVRNERDEFAELMNQYDDIGANVELYEQANDEDLYEEEVLEVEEVIEEEIVDHDDMIKVARR